MILVPLHHMVLGARRLLTLWGLSILPEEAITQTLAQFRPILLDLDADLTRDGLRHLDALEVEPLRIADSLSQCHAYVRRHSANAAIVVPPADPMDGHHPVYDVRAMIGPDMGLVVLVREDDISLEGQLVAAGADAVLSLGGIPASQRARLAALTRRLQESVITQAGDGIYLDSRARQAFLEGRTLPLTDRLFWVLEFLVDHPAQVLTPEDFNERLAAKGVHIRAQSILSLIHRLRRILENHGASGRIRSVHKGGYRWDGPSTLLPPRGSEAERHFTSDIDARHRGRHS